MSIITWNMQGASHSTENKWNEGVANLLTTYPGSIACLQECGGWPSSAVNIGALTFPLPGGIGADVVDIFTWGGTQSRPAYVIFFHNWDQAGNRVNTAVVVPAGVSPAIENFETSVALVTPANGAVWRPALGVLISGAWVFSFHAISPGGPDGAGLLATIAPNYGTWVVGADWNREPNTLTVPAGTNRCPPNTETYPVEPTPNRKLDYCVTSGAAVTGAVQGLIMSDHYPVYYSL